MVKKRIYLTDITFHTRGHRQTIRFAKVAEKGRMYSPLPKGYEENVNSEKGTFGVSIELPQDLKDGMARGEIELMIPKGGLPVYAGKDVHDLIEKMRRDTHRADIHRKYGAKAWRDKQRGV